MKNLVKPIIIVVIGILVFGMAFVFVNKIYNKYIDSKKVVETQVDLNTIYNATKEEAVTLYNGELLEDVNSIKYENDMIYVPVDMVTKYINDQFFYDSNEGILTYTTINDIIRMKTDELTYTINDEPIQIEIAMSNFDGIAYIPLSLLKKFTHHSYIWNIEYNVMQIQDLEEFITVGKVFFDENDKSKEKIDTVYIKTKPNKESQFISKTYVGMNVRIIGEQENYYKIVTDEGFIGYIQKEYVKAVSKISASNNNSLNNNGYGYVDFNTKEGTAVTYRQFPSSELKGKLNLVWHQVTNTTANSSVEEKFENVKGVNVISPTWFTLTGTNGNIRSLASLEYVRWAHSKDIKVWALFSNLASGYTKAQTHEVLSSTAKRTEVIRQLLVQASIYELDGINIDIEMVPTADGPYYVQFCKELAIMAKKQGLVVSVDVPVVKSWTMHYGRSELAKYLDYIMVMGYDEHWGSSPKSGSVASRTWSKEGITETLKEVPKQKLVLGIPFYTRLWTETEVDGKTKVKSKAYSMDYSAQILAENNVSLEWLDDIGQYYGEYKKDGALKRMWLEDTRSVTMRMSYIKDYDIAGVAQWKLGLENDDVWKIIDEYLQ